MKKLLLLLLSPLAAFSSVVYTFSYNTPSGPEGFSYTVPDYFQTSSVDLQGQNFTSCVLGGYGPTYVCADASFVQNPGGVMVTLDYRDAADPFGLTGYAIDGFAGAALTRDGSYRGSTAAFGSSFSIQTVPASAPEPSTWALLGTGLLGAWFWKRRRAHFTV